MRIKSIRQEQFNRLFDYPINLIICSSGYESRSSKHAKKFKKIDSKHICFAFQENRDAGSRPQNDEIYKKLNYNIEEFGGNSEISAENYFSQELESFSETCKIIIDISSMTRAWYGALIKTLVANTKLKQVTTYFVYTPAAFFKHKLPYPPNEVVSPVSGFAGLELPDKPAALIIGLGQDTGRAIGIREALDPVLTLTFIANPGNDKRFYSQVKRANKDLLDIVNPEHQFTFPILDCITTLQYLEGLCSGLQKDWNVVLTSLGPKIFSLCCFLLAVKYPDISVWRISAGNRSDIIDVKPSRSVVVMEVEWGN